MASVLAVYVGESMKANLEIAIERGVWGCPVPQEVQLKTGDFVMFGGGVPGGPRQSGSRPTAADGSELDVDRSWFSKSAGFIVLGRVTSTWFEDDAPIWETPDSYRHRFTFDFVEQFENVLLEPSVNLSAEGSRALRRSGLVKQNGGLQCQGFGEGGLHLVSGGAITDDADPVDPAEFKGDLDVPGTREARAEQAQLRRRLLARDSRCAICARALPDELLVAAHVKKRSECTDDEKRDLDNVAMLACKLGCDAFFEYGYLLVGKNGVVVINKKSKPASRHKSLFADVVGRQCLAHTPESEPYFSWHRKRHG